MQMKLLSHFEFDDGEIIKVTLKDEDRTNFLAKLPEFYRYAYVTETELDSRIAAFGTTRAEELAELIPDRGNIRSGDFGEILAYLFFKERHELMAIDGPLKWHWKQDKNTPAPYTDVILFACPNVDAPCIDDLLVSVESKMKATASESNQIQAAIDGAETDYVSRIANSLAWMRRKYRNEATKVGVDIENIKAIIVKLERFINSDDKGLYTKKVKAITFLDKSWFHEDIARPIQRPTINGLDLTVFAVSIDRLRAAYEEVLTKAVGHDE